MGTAIVTSGGFSPARAPTADEDDPTALVGRWSLRRRMHDRRDGWFGFAVGELVVAPDPDGLTWRESGALRLPGYESEFSRTLLSRRIDDRWWMTFADGRPFHPWAPGVTVEHPCRADLYCGRVDVHGDRLRTHWDVTGPAKDQRVLTACRRIGGES